MIEQIFDSMFFKIRSLEEEPGPGLGREGAWKVGQADHQLGQPALLHTPIHNSTPRNMPI